MQDHPGRGAYHELKVIETNGSDSGNGRQILCNSIAMNGPQNEFLGASYYCYQFYPLTQNAYYKALVKLNLDRNLTVLDGNNRVIFSADPSQIGRDLSGEAYLQQILQGQSMSRRLRKGAEDVLVSYAPVYPYPKLNLMRWNLVKVEPWRDVMRPSLPYRQLLIVLLALGVIVPVVVTAYGVRHITDPIKELIHAAGQVTAGQFDHRIEVKTGDEIETLADEFNVMSAKLEESYSSLERKVAVRTQELAALNAIATRVSSSLHLNEIMADALERIMELTGMEHGIAYRIEGGKEGARSGIEVQESHLRVMALRGFPPSFADLGDGLPLRQSAAGVAGRRGEPMIWTFAELPSEGAIKERLATLGVEQVIAIPLLAKGRLVGSLNLSTNRSRIYAPEQIALLKTIGQQIGVAVENAQLYEDAGQTAISAERNRLARELHDAVTQTLFSANLIADVLPRIWQRNPEEGMRNLEELRQLTRGALAEMRTLLLEMRPESLQRAELKSLITQLADAFVGRVRVPVSLDVQGGCELPQEVKLVFYRVAQEALNNIAKHSGARQVELHLECQPGQVNLLVRDDGLGFDPALINPEHLGMAIMRERSASIGADLKIESQVGQGTRVELDWRPAQKE